MDGETQVFGGKSPFDLMTKELWQYLKHLQEALKLAEVYFVK
jgi:hypothetical protein